MAKFTFVSVLGLALAVSAAPATAATKTFYLNAGDLKENSATEVFNGILLDDDIPNSVVVNITLPSDYKRNTEVILRARMLIPDSGCEVVFSADGTYRYRPGFLGQNLGDPESGLSVRGPTIVTVPAAASEVFTKVFELNRPTAGPFLNQQSGDTISAFLTRQGASGDDDCTGNLTVTSVKVTYETK